LLEIDRLNYLPEYILRKGDLCTMAHGLELRAPLLDHHWVNAVSALSDSQRFTQPAKKFLASAMPKLQALKLFDRKKKGFNPPLDAWMQHDLKTYLIDLGIQLSSLTNGQIDAKAVETLQTSYQTGQKFLAEQVLQLLILEISLRQLKKIVDLE
jgi:asparagine synthase (glutamine-hydrolysing)